MKLDIHVTNMLNYQKYYPAPKLNFWTAILCLWRANSLECMFICIICLITISNIKNDYFWFEHMVFMRSRKSMYTGFSVLLPAGTKCPPEWYNDWHFVPPNRDNRSSLILVPITLSSLPITCNVGIIDSSNMVAFVELWINSIAYI